MNVSLIDGHCENEQKENALTYDKLKDIFDKFETEVALCKEINKNGQNSNS